MITSRTSQYQHVDLQRAEVQVLLACAASRVDPDRTGRVRELISANFDWDLLLSLARRQSMLPLLHWQLSAGCADLMPRDTADLLRDYFQKNTARNLFLTGELISLLRALESRGVSALPYKGPALAVSLYGNLGLRQFGDLDILVRKKDVAVATGVIIERGYKAHFNLTDEQMDRFISLSYVSLFKRDQGRQTIELHWAIAPRFFGFPLDFEGIWSKLRSMELNGQRVLVPPPELLLLMLCVHGAKDAWERLEWVCGVAELLRSEQDLNWGEVVSHAQSTHSTRMLLVGLLLAQKLLNAPLPPAVEVMARSNTRVEQIANKFVPSLISPEPAILNTSQRIRSQLDFKESISQRLSFCLRLGFTSTPVDWATLPLPSGLSFLYLFVRPFRLLRKYSGNPEGRVNSV